MKSAYTPTVIGIVIGLIVGFVAGWYWTENKYASQERQTPADGDNMVMLEEQIPESFSTNNQASNEAIIVSNQKAGSTVVVDTVTLSESGWVAVREMKNSVMGNILGAKRIQNPGTISRVSVELLRPTLPEEMYAIVIYRDDGDTDFDFNFDSLIVRGGEPVTATFTAE